MTVSVRDSSENDIFAALNENEEFNSKMRDFIRMIAKQRCELMLGRPFSEPPQRSQRV